MVDVVKLALMLENVRRFISDAEKSAKAVKGVGDAAEKSGKQAKVSWKSIAKWGGVAAAGVAATRFIRNAVSATEDLGKASLGLQRVTGMDIQTGSQWAAVLKTRNVQVKAFQMGLVKLSREMQKTAKGTKKHDSALEQLGITTSDAAIRSGDTQAVLLRVADAFAKMENPSLRAALAQQLFGRQAIALSPILFKGSAAIEEQLGLAEKYGATLGDMSADEIKEMIANQRELQFALIGVQVQLGTALLPAIIAVTDLFVSFAEIMSPLTKNATLFKIVLAALTVAFLTYKIALIAATIATTFFGVATTAALWPILAVIAAIALLAIGLYLLIKHWDWVKAKMLDLWNWAKKNWPLLLSILLGPIGIATYAIIKNFDKIKAALKSVVDWLMRQINRLKGPIEKLGGWVDKVTPDLPGGGGLLDRFATGGTMYRSGMALVGERGPEIVSLPAGATVTPIPTGALQFAGAFGGEITTRVYLDRREIARAVGDYTSDKMARR